MTIINSVIQGGGGSAPASYRAFQKDSNGKLVSSTSTSWVPLPAGTTDIDTYLFYYAYANTPSNVLSGIMDLSSLTTLSGTSACDGMFSNCTGITSVDLSGLTTLSGSTSCRSMFFGCTSLTSVDLSGLTTVSGNSACAYMFSGCTSLTSVDLSSLTTLNNYSTCEHMFDSCTSLTSVDLSGLTTVSSNSACASMFSNCTSLTSVDLSGLTTINTSAFTNMFYHCTSLTTVTLSDTLTKRNPPVILTDCPLTTNPYENCEYTFSDTLKLCEGMHFSSTNMHAFEMCVPGSSAQRMFANNPYLEQIKFPVLTRWNGKGTAAFLFYGCSNANFTDIYFPMLCVFRNAVPFGQASFGQQTTVHFRKDQQTLIEGTLMYPFGAAACVFDQIGTITVNGIDYIREGKCNEIGYYAWHKASSKITVDGVDYTFDQTQITRSTNPVIAGPILYAWVNGSTTIYTDSLKPQVGDFIWTAFNVAQSTTQSISTVDNEFVYTVDSAEPDVNDTVYSDAQGTVLGTISSIA